MSILDPYTPPEDPILFNIDGLKEGASPEQLENLNRFQREENQIISQKEADLQAMRAIRDFRKPVSAYPSPETHKAYQTNAKKYLQSYREWNNSRGVKPFSAKDEAAQALREESFGKNLSKWQQVFSDEGLDKYLEDRGKLESFKQSAEFHGDADFLRNEIRKNIFMRDLAGTTGNFAQAQISKKILELEDYSDEAFLPAAKEWIEKEVVKRDALEGAFQVGVNAVLSGDDEKIKAERERLREISPKAEESFNRGVQELRRGDGQKMINLARRLVDFEKAEGDRGLFEEGEELTPVNPGTIARLYLKPNGREQFLAILGQVMTMEGGDANVGRFTKFVKNASRTVESTAEGLGRKVIRSEVDEKLADPNLSPEDKAYWESVRQVITDVKDVKAAVSSVEGKNPLEKIFYYGAGSIPYMLMMGSGFGMVTAGLSLQEEHMEDIQKIDPTVSDDTALWIAAISAPIEVGIERLQAGTLFGKFPGIQNAVTKLTAGGLLRRIVSTTGMEYTQETIQDAVLPTTMDIASSLQDEIPYGDWSDFKIFSADRLYGVLGLSILGGGGQYAADKFNENELRTELSDPIRNRVAGLTEANAIEVSKLAIKDGKAAAALFQKYHQELTSEQRNENSKTAMKEAIREARGKDPDEEAPLLYQKEGKSVIDFKDGTKETFDSPVEANERLEQWYDDDSINSRKAIVESIENYKKHIQGDHKVDYDADRSISFGDLERSGVQTAKELKKAIAIYHQQEGTQAPAEIDLDSYTARGMVTMNDMGNAIVALGKDSNPDVVTEEFAEVFIRRLDRIGEKSLPEVGALLKEFGDNVGMDLIAGTNIDQERAIIEGWSNFVRAMAFQSKEAQAAMSEEQRKWYEGIQRAQKQEGGIPRALRAMADLFAKLLSKVFDIARKIDIAKKNGSLNPDLENLALRALGVNPEVVHQKAEQNYRQELARDIGVGLGPAFSPTFSIGNTEVTPNDQTRMFPTKDGGLIGPASFSISAYHGTPHKVDKFTTDKIGTGEGAQAYGYGLYFTEIEGIAKNYRDSLSSGGRGEASLAGVVPSSPDKGLSDAGWIAAKNLSEFLVTDSGIAKSFSSLDVESQGRVKLMVETILEDSKVLDSVVRLIPVDVVNMLGGKKFTADYLLHNQTMLIYLLPGNSANTVSRGVEAMDVLAPLVASSAAKVHTGLSRFDVSSSEADSAFRTGDVSHVVGKIPQPSEFTRGNLYTVNLKVEQDELLDWDKPLGEQSEKVQGLIQRAYQEQGLADPKSAATEKEGQYIYKDIVVAAGGLESLDASKASEYLAEIGIKGIRYLDGNSRSDGEGSYNYVIFNEADIEILEENGKKVGTGPTFSITEDPLIPQPFYSQLERVLDKKVQGKAATPQQLKALLDPSKGSGVKAEEIKWSGILPKIDELAAANDGKVPVPELKDWLATDGRVKFEEVGSIYAKTNEVAEKYGITVDYQYGEAVFTDKDGEDIDFDDLPDEVRESYENSAGESKYSEYQLPGGENYREVVLAMPAKELSDEEVADALHILPERRAEMIPQLSAEDREYAARKSTEEYRSSHFEDVPNYVAHMRLNERENGLFIEEIQSDRHQEARKKGYRGDSKSQWWSIRNADGVQLAAMEGVTGEKALAEWKRIAASQAPNGVEVVAIEKPSYRDEAGVPDAPFRKDWPLAMFKRALRDAVGSGKEWIGWTNGETQNDRYDLSQQVDKVILFPDMTLRAYKDGAEIISQKVTEKELPDIIGKDVAQRLIDAPTVNEAPNENQEAEPHRKLEGEGLKVGGSGMKGFYDKILPTAVQKYVKQWGAKVEQGEILNSTPVWKVPITDKMRDSVKAGQATFSISPAQDAAYLQAVEKGDLETAQSMVDQAAKAAGYDSPMVWHGTRKSFDSFDESRIGSATSKEFASGFHFTTRKEQAEAYAVEDYKRDFLKPKLRGDSAKLDDNAVMLRSYLKITNPLVLSTDNYVSQTNAIDENKNKILKARKRKGIDGVIAERSKGDKYDATDYVVFSASQVKSAEPVTYDDAGNVIPLSERFNEQDGRMTYSISPAKLTLVGEIEEATSAWSELHQSWETAKTYDELRDEVTDEMVEEGVDFEDETVQEELEERQEKVDYDESKEGIEAKLTDASLEAEDGVMAALKKFAEPLGYDVDSGGGNLQSFYFYVSPEIEAQEAFEERYPDRWQEIESLTNWKIRLSDHSNTSNLHESPDVNIQPGDDIATELSNFLEQLPDLKSTIDPTHSIGRVGDPLLEAIEKLFNDSQSAQAIGKRMRARVAKIRDRWENARYMPQDSDDRRMEETTNAVIQLNAIAKVLPVDVRASVGSPVPLLKMANQDTRDKYIIDKLSKISTALEKSLQKTYREKIRKLIDKSTAKTNKFTRRKVSKIGAAGHRVADAAVDAMAKDYKEAQALAEAIRDQYADLENPTLDQFDEAEGRALAYEIFSDYDNADAARLERAIEFLETNYSENRGEWLAKLKERKDTKEGRVGDFLKLIGATDFTDFEDISKAEAKSSPTKQFFQELGSFYNLMNFMAEKSKDPKDRKIVEDITRAFRQARNDYGDSLEARQEFVMDQVGTILGVTKGLNRIARINGKLTALSKKQSVNVTRLRDKTVTEISVPKEEVDFILRRESNKAAGIVFDEQDIASLEKAWEEFEALPESVQNRRKVVRFNRVKSSGKRKPLGMLSQLELAKEWLALQQEDAKEKYEKGGWDDQTLVEIQREMLPETMALAKFMQGYLREMTPEVNAIHREEYGLALAEVENYFPLLFNVAGRDDVEISMDGSNISVSARKGSWLKGRVSHAAMPKIANALSVFQAHLASVEFWRTHAPLLREWGGVLKDQKLQHAMQAKMGVEFVKNLNNWLKMIEADGRDQSLVNLVADQFSQKVQGGLALSVLGGRLRTVLVNMTASLNVLFKVPLADLLRGMKPEVFGDLKTLVMSPTFQRRLKEGGTYEATVALRQKMGGGLAWTTLRRAGQIMMQPINFADTLTNLTTALAYRAKVDQLRKEPGMTEEKAQEEALDYVDEIIAEVAQPTDALSRSLFENKQRGKLGSLLFLFASEARKNTALMGLAARKILTNKGSQSRSMAAQQLFVGTFIYAGLGYFLKAVVESLFKEDDEDKDFEARLMERLTDEKAITQALATEHLRGLPLLGEGWSALTASAINASPLEGEKIMVFNTSNNPLMRVAMSASRATKISSAENADEMVDALLSTIRGVAGVLPETAIFSQGANIAEDGLGLWRNLTGDMLSEDGAVKKVAKRVRKIKEEIYSEDRDAYKEAKGTQKRMIEDRRKEEFTAALREVFAEIGPDLTEKVTKELEGTVSKEVFKELSRD